ncbi:FtsB family cell division protein [Paenibacillus sp. DYY-L-2]|uniref:FtsB family cell division protein n=1 Tax=Paenibacillus sp. DYY-L-2 TaxID=3447013 RepID=UPI003F50B76F
MRESRVNEKNTTAKSPKSTGARRRIRLWMGFMAVFIGWACYTYIAQSGEIGAKADQLAQQQATKEENEQILNQLKYELNRLQDPEYIGQIAMKKYGLYKPGEIPVRVSETESAND